MSHYFKAVPCPHQPGKWLAQFTAGRSTAFVRTSGGEPVRYDTPAKAERYAAIFMCRALDGEAPSWRGAAVTRNVQRQRGASRGAVLT